ncbi:MAG: 4Fe-4S binding protein [Actinobacteria bacterium]|nr:4Fe-4S binding protein [Actinomycetota bacterium]
MALVQNSVQYAVGKWIDENHPRPESGRCIDIKQKKVSCGACRDICPTGATLSCRDRNWEACMDCNLCVAACPTRALRPSAKNVDKFLRAIESGVDKITISCEQCEEGAYLQMYCMGAIPWEVLACLALDKQVVLDTTFCADCPEVEGKAQLEAMLEQVKEFLGDAFFDKQISVSGETKVGGLSRREAFSFIRGIGKNVTENLLSAGKGTPIEGSFFRKVLAARLEDAQDGDPDFYTLSAPIFNENCWACNLCKNACPEHAISIIKDDQTGEYFVNHTAWKCVSCGLCRSTCPDEGISGQMLFETNDPLDDVRYKASPSICTKCDKNFKPDGNVLCPRCVRVEENKAKLAANKTT